LQGKGQDDAKRKDAPCGAAQPNKIRLNQKEPPMFSKVTNALKSSQVARTAQGHSKRNPLTPSACVSVVEPLEERRLFTVLLFEPAAADRSVVPQSYGDRVTNTSQGGFRYGSAGGFTPNVTVVYGPVAADVARWGEGYGDLRNVIYREEEGAGVLEVKLTADPGFDVGLRAFDLAGYQRSDHVINSVTVRDAAGKTLFSRTQVKVEGDAVGPQHSTFAFAAPLTSSALVIRVDSRNLGALGDDVGMDNICFSQSVVAGDADDQISEARRTSVGATVTGRAVGLAADPVDGHGRPTDVDMFKFTVREGQRVGFDLDRPVGSSLDSVLRVFTKSGTFLVGNDNAAAPGEAADGRSSYVEMTFTAAGEYYVAVSAKPNASYNPVTGAGDVSGGTGGAYSLQLTDRPVALSLSLNATQTQPAAMSRLSETSVLARTRAILIENQLADSRLLA
jgi:hypothetical protein